MTINSNNTTQTAEQYLTASAFGGAASGMANAVAYPFEVVKTRQQITGTGIIPTVKTLLQNEGAGGFFKGLGPKIAGKTMNGLWVWPAMKGSLASLDQHTDLPPIVKQVITATGVAAVSTVTTNPFDKARVDAITKNLTNSGVAAQSKPASSFTSFLRNGWQGAGANWMNTTVNHTAFLVGQKYFQKKPQSEDGLKALPVYLETGAKVAATMTAASTVVDAITTHKMSSGTTLKDIVRSNPPSLFVRGSIANFCGRVVRHTVNAWAMDKINM